MEQRIDFLEMEKSIFGVGVDLAFTFSVSNSFKGYICSQLANIYEDNYVPASIAIFLGTMKRLGTTHTYAWVI